MSRTKEEKFNAVWYTHEDEEVGTVYLQIELGGDYAVLLGSSPHDGPSVTLWYGSGEHEFTETPEHFREWIKEVTDAVTTRSLRKKEKF